jgi:superfamily II RNA helicase
VIYFVTTVMLKTLSAGINMPARTTVICSLAKRGDSGMVLLETSNLLQMAGRAGRRGFDEKGKCKKIATEWIADRIQFRKILIGQGHTYTDYNTVFLFFNSALLLQYRHVRSSSHSV